MSNVFLAELSLGYTRVVGALCYSPQTREFNEFTTAIAKKMIKSKELLGVKWEDDANGGGFIPDEEFGMTNLLVKSGVGKYRPLYNDIPEMPVNSMYVVTRVLDTDYRGRLFEVVNQKCQRVKLNEEQIRKLADLTQVAGVRITDDDIEILDGIQYEDRRVHLSSGKNAGEEKKEVVKKASPAKSTKKATSAAAKKRSTTAKRK